MESMQEIIVNVLFIAVLVVIGATLGWDVYKKRKRLKTAQREEAELTEALQTKLPEGYRVLTDVFLLTKVGRSRVDFVIVSPYGIFALEYRQFYVYIRADEEISRWTYAPGIKGKPFTSPLYQSMVHLHCIRELIDAQPNLRCYPMAAFPTVAEIELKNPMDDAFVGLVPDVLPFIESMKEEVCLSAEEIDAIVKLLELNSEKVKEMEQPAVIKETPEEYKVYIPGDFRDPEDEDDDEDEDDESALDTYAEKEDAADALPEAAEDEAAAEAEVAAENAEEAEAELEEEISASEGELDEASSADEGGADKESK